MTFFVCLVLQPDDHGLIGDVPVLRVTRQGPEAVHFVSSPLDEGQEVQVKVDWERRFDHMQQHTGEGGETQAQSVGQREVRTFVCLL